MVSGRESKLSFANCKSTEHREEDGAYGSCTYREENDRLHGERRLVW